MTDLRIWPSFEYCGICGDILVKREPRNGKTFEPFLGCRSFPECKGARQLINGEPVPELWELDDLGWIMEGT